MPDHKLLLHMHRLTVVGSLWLQHGVSPLQSHSSIKKACMVAGTPYVRIIPASPEDDYAFDAAALEEAIREDIDAGLLPFYCVATIGNTSSCAVDPIAEIGRITQQYGLW